MTKFNFSKRVPADGTDAVGVILKAAADPKIISFAGGLPAPELFPVKAMKEAVDQVFAERGQEGIAKVRDILGGGADVALECVGTEAAVDQALGVLHNGGRMGFVGVPHYNNRALGSTFAQNITVAGGAASVTTYDKQILLKAVLDGDINPGRVFTSSYKLEDIDQAYKDMDERKTIKAMIVIDEKRV